MRRLLREWHWHRRRSSLAAIELLVLDVDGVLTDGGLWFDPNGLLQKRFDVRDGLGLRLLQKAGVQLAFLSGGKGGATEVRARQLGIEHCLVGIKDKPDTYLTLPRSRLKKSTIDDLFDVNAEFLQIYFNFSCSIDSCIFIIVCKLISVDFNLFI